MRGIKNIATEINASNWNNAVELFNGAILEGLITDRFRYDITAYAYVSSLNARCYIPSINQSQIPKIYPEDSYYQRWEKKQDVLQGSIDLQIFYWNLATENGLNLGIVKLPYYGGIHTENLLIELITNQTEGLAIDSHSVLKARCLNQLHNNDSINIFGMAEYQLDTLPKTPSLTQPENFGISVGNTPTLIRAANTYRYRLHLQNTGSVGVWFSHGLDTSAIAYQVNVYGYRLTLHGMTS
ncbi:hypothetical protein [Limnospira indica]|uniref:Uncharacterized protein n=1 Tax=Limnospira indica PCC 8005 TaxID=376219 RepID=A0A9P1KE81_9CYAN|nr:hypothetical protein [Limnospira indica]CDM94534.1 conserved protein of unknown function [Limnospira indica PCC 8005]